MHEVDYYELLGVRRNASTAHIRSAYRSLAKVMHPDAGGSVTAFQQLQRAYETLIDPALRSAYDTKAALLHPEAKARTSSWVDRVARHRPRRFGGDPGFEPTVLDLDRNTISWWNSVHETQQVTYIPLVVPGHAPAVIGLASWLLLLSAVVAIDLSPLLLASWIILMASASVGIVQLARRYAAAARLAKSFAAELGAKTEFGVPGQEREELAQRLTAQLLTKYLTHLPAVRIFHGIRLPDSVFADVDHAVLCGQRLVLIESKLWLPGHYSAHPDGRLWRNNHPFRGGVVSLPKAVTAYRQLLPEIEVRGAVLVYPSRAGSLTTSEPLDILAPPMTPEWFVRHVGEWLAVQPSTVDRDVLQVLREQCAS